MPRPSADVTVAVKVTDELYTLGSAEDASDVVVVAGAGAGATARLNGSLPTAMVAVTVFVAVSMTETSLLSDVGDVDGAAGRIGHDAVGCRHRRRWCR